MIEEVVKRWHAIVRGEVEDGLDEILADDVVFYSPVVFTPQKGKDITKLYLQAAAGTFSGDGQERDASSGSGGSRFRYTKQVISGNQAVLEFESELGGKYINGVDIIECNDEGRVVEFRVMIRPLQAVNMMHARMKAMLEKMQGV